MITAGPSPEVFSRETPAPRDDEALEAAVHARERRAERPGERPGRDPGFDYDYARHTAAYYYGVARAAGLRVLDAGCGDGVGSQLLARGAREVVGVDHSRVAIDQCRRLWHDRSNLRFEVVDLSRPGTFHEKFDLVTNIQVFEHIHDPQPFLRSLADCLAPGGTLILCTPNRLRSASENPFHVHEYVEGELRDVLAPLFGEVRVLGIHGNEKVERFEERRARAVRRILRLDPFGLRNLLPRSTVEFAFAHLARLVRRQTTDAEEQQIVPEDFHVSEGEIERAIDLLAVCRAAG